MNERQLNRNLLSIGKECFVSYFKEFDGPWANRDLALQISNESNGKRGFEAAQTRVSKARKIIQEGLGEEALVICSKAKVPSHIKARAIELADQLRKSSLP